MTDALAARLRSATLTQVQAYRRARVRQGYNIIARWHHAKALAERYPHWLDAQDEWQTAQALRAHYEAGLAEIDAIIATKATGRD